MLKRAVDLVIATLGLLILLPFLLVVAVLIKIDSPDRCSSARRASA